MLHLTRALALVFALAMAPPLAALAADAPAPAQDAASARRVPYEVRPGDSLAVILREQAGVPDNLIFNEYIERFKALNPQVENVHRLRPGMLVYLPVPPGPDETKENATPPTPAEEALPGGEPEATREPSPAAEPAHEETDMPGPATRLTGLSHEALPGGGDRVRDCP